MSEEIRNKEYIDTLIIDWLSGSIAEDDARALKTWLNESEKHQMYFNGMKELWDSSVVADPVLTFNHERAYSLFIKRIRERTASVQAVGPERKKISMWRRIASVAVVMIPLVVFSYYMSLYFKSQVEDTAPLLSELVCPRGSMTQMVLPDGTKVWLNSDSRLLYNDRFGKDNRELELQGEAFLDVTRNERLPLVVKVNDLDIKVLGTKFNVNAYSGEEEIKVSLLEGSVGMKVDGKNDFTVLKPMETGIYQVASHQIEVKPGLDGSIIAWMENQLIFTGEPFDKIARILERRFNVTIRIHTDELKRRSFGGDFGEGESIEKILKVMAVNGKFKYKIMNSTIDIY